MLTECFCGVGECIDAVVELTESHELHGLVTVTVNSLDQVYAPLQLIKLLV